MVVGCERCKGPKKEKPEARRVLRRRMSSKSCWLFRGDGSCGIDDGRCMASIVWGGGTEWGGQKARMGGLYRACGWAGKRTVALP